MMPNIPVLSIVDGSLLAGAVIGVWALSWGFQALYLSLKGSEYHENDD